MRGLIELSNHCVRLCGYCGLRAGNTGLQRYRMSDDEVLECAQKAVEFGYGTVVLQSGEDPELTCQRIAGLVRRIKADTALAITLSLGEREDDELAACAKPGPIATCSALKRRTPRCTSDPSAADRHSVGRWADLRRDDTGDRAAHRRMAILATLARLGYEVGSGVMIGIPGQTYDDLADDIEWFARLDLDMIGVGPYLPHPNTPLADREAWPPAADGQQVPATKR